MSFFSYSSGKLSSVPVVSNRPKKSKKNVEDSMAMIFMAIILIFLICHLPRILLDIYELGTVNWVQYCEKHGRWAINVWSVILVNISHLLLVLSSSMNMIVYGLLGSKFRMEAKKTYKSLCTSFCVVRNQANNNCIVV